MSKARNIADLLDANGDVVSSSLDNVVSGLTSDATVKTANFTATAGNRYYCNTSGGAFTLTLPASPTADDEVGFVDYGGNFATNNLTIGRNSTNIMGLAEDLAADSDNVSIVLKYVDATQGWMIV